MRVRWQNGEGSYKWKKIERGMVKVRCNDIGWRPVALFGDSKTLKSFLLVLFTSCNLLFVIFIFNTSRHKNEELDWYKSQTLSISYRLVLKYDGSSMGFHNDTTFSVSCYEEYKWMVRSLMKGLWVCFAESIIICFLLCICAKCL